MCGFLNKSKHDELQYVWSALVTDIPQNVNLPIAKHMLPFQDLLEAIIERIIILTLQKSCNGLGGFSPITCI